MYDYAIQVVEEAIQKLEFKKTDKYFEKENCQKKINRIDTYLNLQKQLKSNKTDSLFYLWMTISSGIGSIVFPPLLVIAVAFMVLTALNTKESLKMKKRLEKRYANLSNLSKQELLKEKKILFQKMNEIEFDYNNISNYITKCKLKLNELNVCAKISKNSIFYDIAKKAIANYRQSRSELPIEEYFTEKINYPNYYDGSNRKIEYYEKPKQYRKVV